MHQHEGVTELDVIWLAFYYPFCIILAAIICHLTYAQLEESVKATLKEQGIPAPDTEDKGSHDLPVDEVTGQKASPWSLEVSIPISLFHTVFQIYLFHQAADHANFIARENV
ncbi:hypothetical protein PMZ80_007522 [Knufia obscura]|nr:hypothetical protein PMZ80_007522 [Knufia obscura]